jgi:hypothetical protein
MTEHDRIVFDLKGFLIKLAVLPEEEVAELREFVLRQRNAPEVLEGLTPEHRRFFREVYHPQFDRMSL